MDLVVTLIKNTIFFIGLFFTIVLMGKKGPAVRSAVRGKNPVVSTDYTSNGQKY